MNSSADIDMILQILDRPKSQSETSPLMGLRAVELIKTWHADGIQYQALTVHIEAVPGSKYYRIGCVTPLSRYNETLPKFQLVINSFKLLKS